MSPLRFLIGIFLIYQPPLILPPSVFSSQLKPTSSNINCLGQNSLESSFTPSPSLSPPNPPWPSPGSNSFVAASRFYLDPKSKTRSYNLEFLTQSDTLPWNGVQETEDAIIEPLDGLVHCLVIRFCFVFLPFKNFSHQTLFISVPVFKQ